MDLIELFSGFKNKRLRRTALSKVTSGLDQLSTLVTGVITANKDLVFNTIRAVINTKACGHLINVTVKVPSGVWKTKNLDVNIQAIGSRTRSTAEAHFSIRMATDTTDTGSTVCHKVKVV